MLHTRFALVPSLAGLLLIGCAPTASQNRSPHDVAPTSTVAIDPAISAVYPALVQILVVVETPEGGRLAKEQAAGSGAIISRDGFVVTNHHVVGHAIAVRCVLADHREVDADVVGSDALCDIAILRLLLPPGVSVPAVAAWGDSGSLRIGDPVYAMGCPLALAQSVTRGIVSNPSITLPKLFGGEESFKLDGETIGSLVTWIAHDAVIFPGNSGGPLVDAGGRIVGINELGLGLSGAIPADIAKPVADALINSGSVRRAWLGLGLRPLLRDAPISACGVLIADVRPGSPAALAGMVRGDQLLAVTGQALTVRYAEELPALQRRLAALPVGEPCTLTVAHDGVERHVTVVPELRDIARGQDHEIPELALIARRITRDEAAERNRTDTRGALVGGMRSGGAAASALPPLVSGDVVLAVDGQAVADDAALAHLCHERCAAGPTALLLTIARRGQLLACRVDAGLRQLPAPAVGPRRAWFPGLVQAVTPPLAQALGLPAIRGVRITELKSGASTDLHVGDVVVKIDDQLLDVRGPHDTSIFFELIAAYEPGAIVNVTIRRIDNEIVVPLTLGQRPHAADELAIHIDYRLEFATRDVTADDRDRLGWPEDIVGSLVTDTDAGGWAAVGGLRADDLIIDLDHTAITTTADLIHALAATPADQRRSAVAVRRGASSLILEIERPSTNP